VVKLILNENGTSTFLWEESKVQSIVGGRFNGSGLSSTAKGVYYCRGVGFVALQSLFVC
jgi:hypothetical protein